MTAPTASTMAPRPVLGAQMSWRESTFAELMRFMYNQQGISYNESNFTYNYTEARGYLDPRIIAGPTMEGRL